MAGDARGAPKKEEGKKRAGKRRGEEVFWIAMASCLPGCIVIT